jgi:hypothetical protein
MAGNPHAVPSIAEVQASELLRTGFRAGHPLATVNANLGLLAEFQGNWRGTGFNITARPFFQSTPPFFLHGLRYLQQVTDAVTNSGIHVEPGLWLHVPATDVPQAKETYVRQATVPHGDSLIAQSLFATELPGGPVINPVDSTPFKDAVIPALTGEPADPVTDTAYLSQYLTNALPAVGMPPGLDPMATIKDPTSVLRAQIAGQDIVNTAVIAISTAAPAGGILNIPFVTKNANAAQMDAIFWAETVRHPNGHHFIQLQYVQRVILDFIGIQWPHFSVATLVRI